MPKRGGKSFNKGIGLMRLASNLVKGRLLKRYKRFLADIELESGEIVTAHCANTGKMTGCLESYGTVWLSQNNNPARKLKYSWELSETSAGHIIGIHSAKANDIVDEALTAKVIETLARYDKILREVKVGSKSRIDFMLSNNIEQCFVEVKSVTLLDGNGIGMFPDTVSERASRHVKELISIKRQGHRAVLFFCVQHSGINVVCPADNIDTAYGEIVRQAITEGVEVLVYRCQLSVDEIKITMPLPWFDSLKQAQSAH
jgi:sugar fermentation stimulation protein A